MVRLALASGVARLSNVITLLLFTTARGLCLVTGEMSSAESMEQFSEMVQMNLEAESAPTHLHHHLSVQRRRSEMIGGWCCLQKRSAVENYFWKFWSEYSVQRTRGIINYVSC